jgi:glycosyltransferase involved in cell wall biosynthesis
MTAELVAALADALGARLQMESELQKQKAARWQLEDQLLRQKTETQQQEAQLRQELLQTRYDLQAEVQQLRGQQRQVLDSSTWKMAQVLRVLGNWMFPPFTLRRTFLNLVARGVKAATWPLRAALGRGGLSPVAEASAPSEAELDALVRRAAAGPRPVIFLPSIPWSVTLFQRPQHLARELARRGHLVVYDCSGTNEDVQGFREIEPNLLLYRGDARHLGRLPNPLLWTFSYNYHLAGNYVPDADCIYDWIDDLSVFDYDQGLLRRNHRRALKEARVVASVARRLHEEARRERPDALYLPNGVQYEHFAEPPAAPVVDADAAPFLESDRPLAGYYGAIARWFDYGLLQEVADRRRDWNFLLIGPNYDGSIERQDLLRRCPNVRWIGPRHYQTLPGYLHRFDVATIPFAINDITLATSPLKLYEYFAGGKPVITTAMPECMAYPVVRIARDSRDFSRHLDEALAEGRSPAFRRRLQQIARENSWAERVGALLNHLAAGSRRAAG